MGTARGDINVITADTSLGQKIGAPTTTFNEDFLPNHSHPHTIGTSVSMTAAGGHSHAGATGSMNRSNPHGHAPIAASGQLFLYSGGVDYGFPKGPIRLLRDNEMSLPHFWARAVGGTENSDINHEHAIGSDGGHTHPLSFGISGGITEVTAGAAAKTIGIIQPSVVVNFFMKV